MERLACLPSGFCAAATGARHFGESLAPPAAIRVMRRAGDTAICREYDRIIADMSGNAAVARLARAHSLSDRRIFGILKGTAAPTVDVGGAVQLRLMG